MKKIIKATLITLLTFVMLANSNCIHADMGMSDPEYDQVMIINENGVEINGYKDGIEDRKTIFIPYGTIVEVKYEDGYNFEIEYDGYSGNVSVYDIKPVIDSFSPTEKTEKVSPYPKKVIILDGDNYLYKGPAFSFDKAKEETIPLNTIIEYEYYYTVLLNKWIYCEYDGAKGWLLINDTDENERNNIMNYVGKKATLKAYAEIYDNSVDAINEEGNYDICENEQEVEMLFEKHGFRGGCAKYIENKNISGWVNDTSLIVNNSGNLSLFLFSEYPIDVYGDADLTDVIDNTTLDGTYTPISFKYIEFVKPMDYFVATGPYDDYAIKLNYNGDKEGYVSYNSLCVGFDMSIAEDIVPTNPDNVTVTLYSKPTEKSEIIKETNIFDGAVQYYAKGANNDYWIYINGKETSGWIKDFGPSIFDWEDDMKLMDIRFAYTASFTTPPDLKDEVIENKNTNSENKEILLDLADINNNTIINKLDYSQIIIYVCIAVAIAGVIVLIFNNRKKQ